MSRSHDVGGTEGVGAISREADEPAFHQDWEARVFALNRLLLARRVYNLDEFRYAIERMAPDAYARASYYERWLVAIETLLREKGVFA
jgi:nitrile hydratase